MRKSTIIYYVAPVVKVTYERSGIIIDILYEFVNCFYPLFYFFCKNFENRPFWDVFDPP